MALVEIGRNVHFNITAGYFTWQIQCQRTTTNFLHSSLNLDCYRLQLGHCCFIEKTGDLQEAYAHILVV